MKNPQDSKVSRRGVLAASAAGACVAAWGGAARGEKVVREEGPRLFTRPGLLGAAGGLLRGGGSEGLREAYGRMAAAQPGVAAELARRYGLEKPGLGFAERSMLLDAVVSAGVATAAGHADAGAMRAGAVGAAMALVGALGRAGSKARDYHVGQGSNMFPLAVAYDWLYADLSGAQRRAMVGAMLAYSFVPTLEAMYVGGPGGGKAFWVNGYNNWTTINLGGAVGFALALRAGDDPGPVGALRGDGTVVTRSVAEHLAEFLPVALANLRRGFLVIRNNNGLQPEGTGYHHDTVLPLYGLVATVESCFAPGERPGYVAEFLEDAGETAGVHIHAGIHMAGPTGADWEYADGTWPLTGQPINLLIAALARERGAALAAAAGHRALELGGTSDLGLHVLYRAMHDPAPQVDPAAIPTAHYFFSRLVEPAKKEVAINEFVVTWRQRFGSRDSAGVFFKGGDRRGDYHSHLDVGTFLYDALGVRWAVDVGNAAGYPYYFKDGAKDWKAVTLYQAYAKRACAHNTLVINPADNDYTRRGVVANDWMWQFNPDQATHQDGTSVPVSPVEGIELGDATYRGSVNLLGAYQRHRVRSKAAGAPDDPRRTFEFDRASGTLTITDVLHFTEPGGNEVHWLMNVPAAVKVLGPEPAGRTVLAGVRGDGAAVYLAVEVVRAVGGKVTPMRIGSAEATMPPGQPGSEVLFGYANAKAHRERHQKLALRVEDVGAVAEICVRLVPMGAWTGKTGAEVRRG